MVCIEKFFLYLKEILSSAFVGQWYPHFKFPEVYIHLNKSMTVCQCFLGQFQVVKISIIKMVLVFSNPSKNCWVSLKN